MVAALSPVCEVALRYDNYEFNLNMDPNVNFSGSNLDSWPVRSLKFGVVSILDLDVNPPLQT